MDTVVETISEKVEVVEVQVETQIETQLDAVVAVADDVEAKVEETAEQIAIEIAERKPLTIVTEFANSYEDDINLDAVQEQIVAMLYKEAKEAAEPILNDDSLPISVKITKLLGAIMGLLEKLRLNGEKVANENKRVIALYLLKRLIKEILANSELRDKILYEVDQAATYLLEALVSVSKGMNALIHKAEKEVMDKVKSFSCCDCIQAFIGPRRK